MTKPERFHSVVGDEHDWHAVTGDRQIYRITDLILHVLIAVFVFPLMYTLIGMARIADYISHKRRRAAS